MASGMVRGVGIPGWKPPKSDGKKETYAASIEQQAGDYDELMNRYRRFLDSGMDPGLASLANMYKGQIANPNTYRSAHVDPALNNLQGMSQTGGYTTQGKADLRARGVSPIRAIYANAQQNLDRQRALQGGYSPNYTAATAKLTRDLSSQISDQVTDVNAGIAQNVASNRVSLAPSYANAAIADTNSMRDNQAQNLAGLSGVYGMQQNVKNNALAGMTNLYGTTPALSQLYGNQALNVAQLGEQQKARKQSGGVSLINAYNGARRY